MASLLYPTTRSYSNVTEGKRGTGANIGKADNVLK